MYLKKLGKKSISWVIWDRLIDCHSNARAPRFEKQVKTLILTGFCNGMNFNISPSG